MMPLYAKPATAEDSRFETPPEGEACVVLEKISAAKDDKEGRARVLLTWRACTQVDSAGRAFRYFDSVHNKLSGRLMHIIETLTGSRPDPKSTDYDLNDLLGLKLKLTIEHSKDGKYANVASYRPAGIDDEDLEHGAPVTEDDVRKALEKTF